MSERLEPGDAVNVQTPFGIFFGRYLGNREHRPDEVIVSIGTDTGELVESHHAENVRPNAIGQFLKALGFKNDTVTPPVSPKHKKLP